MGFIYEGRGKEQRTEHERIAMSNIRGALNWIVGGYYNCIQDDTPEYLPKSREDLANEIYDSALVNLYAPGCERTGKAPREMRFAGEKFCREYIEYLMKFDGDCLEIADYLGWK